MSKEGDTLRVALYARVSTEEQAKHGLSIDAQLAALRAWALEGGHVVAGEYVDLGVSARKDPAKRPELQRLLGDLDKVDAVAFTKLDRWTRNIKGYFKVQELLDARKVAWIAIQENYETVTASGRFKVNIMLSVAENEADRTAERIRVVFERKVQNGEAITGAVPLGYSLVDRRLVPNADAEAVRAVFDGYRRSGSIYAAVDCLHLYGFRYSYTAVKGILHNTLYSGRYRGNARFCEPIIPPEDFDAVQHMLEIRSFRRNPSGRVYLFSGLVRCAVCGQAMAGCAYDGRRSPVYRCNKHYIDRKCSNARSVPEPQLEAWLVEHVIPAFASLEAGLAAAKKKKPVDRAAINRKLNRLKDLYVDGLIDKPTYLADRENLLSQLPPEDPQPDLSAVRDILLQDGFEETYASLTREEKRSLWRSVLDHVTSDEYRNYSIFFIP